MKIKFPDFNKRLILYLLSFITIGFLLLTAFVLIDPVSSVDIGFSGEIQEHSSHPLDIAMKGVSWFGYMPNAVFLVIIVAFLFFIFKYKREALFAIFTLLSGLASSTIKFLVNRPRPLPSLVNILEKARQQSFPSGHVVFYIVFFGFLILLMFRLSAINKILRLSVSACCLLLIFAVPVSRIYLGAHWFTDVLGGLLLGLLCLYVLSYFYLNQVPRRSPK